LKEEIEMHLSYMSSMHVINKATWQAANRISIEGIAGVDDAPPVAHADVDPRQTVLRMSKTPTVGSSEKDK
jgi:hypothetical protein